MFIILKNVIFCINLEILEYSYASSPGKLRYSGILIKLSDIIYNVVDLKFEARKILASYFQHAQTVNPRLDFILLAHLSL